MASTDEMDNALLSNVTTYWRKVAMVAAMALEQLKLPSTGENFEELCRRVESLAKEGRLDYQGKLSLPRRSEVRLPDKRDSDA